MRRVAAVQQRGLTPHYPAQMDKQLSHAQPDSARAGAPLSHPSLTPRIGSEPAEITVKFIPSSPAHTVPMHSEFLTWYSHFSHQQILTGAWALCQLFELILFLTIGILCVKLHKDKLMLWNNLKQEEKGKKTKLDHFRSEQSTSHQRLLLLVVFFLCNREMQRRMEILYNYGLSEMTHCRVEERLSFGCLFSCTRR